MGFWTNVLTHQKIIKKLLHGVSILIDLSALRDAVNAKGWLKSLLTIGAKLI
jgi:hypothetical protein